MISSLLHRLNLVEQTLTGNAQLLSELQLLEFEAGPCQRDAERGRDLDTLRDFLRRLEPRLAHSTNRLHRLTAAVIRQRAQLADLKSLSRTSGAPSLEPPLPSGAIDADVPLPDETLPITTRDFALQNRLPSRRNSPTDYLTPSSDCTDNDARCCHLAYQLVNMYRTSVDGCAGVAGSPRVSVAGGVDCAPREGGRDTPDVVVEMLETEVQKQERLIERMVRFNETMANKEQEYDRKSEWYEHKMRLLKQDKRKRGETIGKLLRCIDDMRETGGVTGGIRETDETSECPTTDDQGPASLSRGMREEAGGGWTEEALRDVVQELREEARLRDSVSVEICRSSDLGLAVDEDRNRLGLGEDEDGSRFGFDRQQKPPDFVVRHYFPSLFAGSAGRGFLPPGQDRLPLDTDSRYRNESSSGHFLFSQ